MNLLYKILLYLVKLNGVYDIICAMSILDVFGILDIPVLQNIHLSMFLLPLEESSEPNKLCKRMLAYWIFTYGIIRLYSSEPHVISRSYYIEAIFIANESLVKNTMHINKAYFVICTSILFGFMVEIS
uniref:Uncharacterized protein n=1 Tax=viral metagenome TaxID=1070528 RepID=A0A6C0HHM5_9ZZZZ